MKGKIFTLTAVLVFGFLSSALAEPAAKLLPYTSYGKQALAAQGKGEADALKDFPSKEMVGLPVYPGSYYGTVAKSNNVLSSVQFASKDGPEKIIAWYKERLGSEWKYLPDLATKELGEIGVFIRTSKDNVSAMDALSSQQIRIAKVEKAEDTGFVAMVFDVSGVKAMISMQIKPLI